ncbi:MAG: Rieske 2Fe-2S domain-containing protein [Marmoricola sp.]
MSDDHKSGTLEQIESEPIANPGLPEHLPRPTDVDPEMAKRAERQVATLFGLSSVFAVLFCVAYFTLKIKGNPTVFLNMGASTVALGACLGGALMCIGIGAIQWSRKLMSDHEIVEYRHSAASPQEDRDEAIASLEAGIEDSGIARRPLVRNSLLGALGFLGLPAIVALRDLGPLPGDKLAHTVWTKGMEVVQDVDGARIRPEDMEIGQLVNAEPSAFFPQDGEESEYEGAKLQAAKAKAAVILVRMHPDDIKPWKGRENWGVDGILCFSKICTHVGCPISLWEQQTHHLLCPCHQSTFDLADNGKVIFGPAGRHLPQLPIEVDADGYLVAQSDFHEPVGPSYWERG